MKESRAFLGSIAAGIALAVLVGASLSLYSGSLYSGAAPSSTASSLGSLQGQLTSGFTSSASAPATSSTTVAATSAINTSTGAVSATSSSTAITFTTSTVYTSSTAQGISSTTTTGSTEPCSTTGVQCGSLQIISASLVASPSANGASNLTLTLENTGNVNINNVEVFLNHSVNSSVVLGEILAGQQMTFIQTIKNANYMITAGQTYTISVEGFIIQGDHIEANLWESIQVVASGISSTTTLMSTSGCSSNSSSPNVCTEAQAP